MDSPFTGGKVSLEVSKKPLTYKGKTYTIYYHSYKCRDSGEFFTTGELDDLNIAQVKLRHNLEHE